MNRPRGSGPLWYFREGVRIARFDESAIRRAADDRRSLFYGMAFIAVGTLATQLSAFFRATPADPANASWGPAVQGAIIIVPVQLLVSSCSIGLIHGAARLLFGATGRCVALLRALWHRLSSGSVSFRCLGRWSPACGRSSFLSSSSKRSMASNVCRRICWSWLLVRSALWRRHWSWPRFDRRRLGEAWRDDRGVSWAGETGNGQASGVSFAGVPQPASPSR